jgi:superfamily I DNA and RNA helicase
MPQQPGQFIATEPLGSSGEAGEVQVWDAVRLGFADRPCVGYWRYPVFSPQSRKEPDILIADRQLGLIIIEVKTISIDQILGISGHQWQLQNFYTTTNNPYQQAENQLYSVLRYCDAEPQLQQQVCARVMVALPQITRQQWQDRKFDRLPTSPPILFQDCLPHILAEIDRVPPLQRGNPLTEEQWKLLLAVLGGTSVHRPPPRRVFASSQSRASILTKVRERSIDLDWQQERTGKQIPPGPQRIRGIAGSGKTVLLCQKAAQMHLKYPHWDIALVFFTRTLSDTLTQQLDRWLHRFSQGNLGYNPQNPKLRLLQAWGSQTRPGLYSVLCQSAGVSRLAVNDLHKQKPNEALAQVCHHLLQHTKIPQIFDAILIDEAQDLLVEDTRQFGNKQPFYWMAYQALKPVNPQQPQLRRLIWAYDEAQSLDSGKIPTAEELLGVEFRDGVTGRYPGDIAKSETLSRSYRTPGPILTAAHAMGMGLLRWGGMLRGSTQIQDWQAIGYDVTGKFVPGERVTLHRPRHQSPNPIPQMWQTSVIEFEAYPSRQDELNALADRIWHNLKYDGLRPSREILVVVLGAAHEVGNLERYVAQFLIDHGIDIFLPTATDCNQLYPHPRDRERFWCVGCVTVSRVYRAKGNEAAMVYVVGLDRLAEQESNPQLRNQLVVALTRSIGWVRVSGVGSYPLYEEFDRVIRSGETLTFTFQGSPQQPMERTEMGELVRRYAPGRDSLEGADLTGANLGGIDLRHANLIGTQLVGADLTGAMLDGAKLAIANLAGAKLVDASLRGAKLVGAILCNAQLTRADLTGANLSGADLSGADLTDAQIDRTNLADAIFAEE